MSDQVNDFYRLSKRASCRAVDAAANAIYTFTKPTGTDRVSIAASNPDWVRGGY